MGLSRARALAVLMIALGVLLLIDAGVTLVWQEPISALYALLRQDRLGGELRGVERLAPTPAERRTLASLADERQRITFLARELARRAGDGSPVARIVIPRIGASYVVVNGTDTQDLRAGQGSQQGNEVPGDRGHDGDRGAPDDIPGAFPQHQPAVAR